MEVETHSERLSHWRSLALDQGLTSHLGEGKEERVSHTFQPKMHEVYSGWKDWFGAQVWF